MNIKDFTEMLEGVLDFADGTVICTEPLYPEEEDIKSFYVCEFKGEDKYLKRLDYDWSINLNETNKEIFKDLSTTSAKIISLFDYFGELIIGIDNNNCKL